MLSQNQVVKLRKAIEKTYDGICTVTVHQEYDKENGSTGFREEAVLTNKPCKLSFSTVNSTSEGDAVSSVTQAVKLFIAPELDIPSGSKITVTQNNVTVDYTRSGKPAIYPTHQELELDLFQRWS